MDGWTVPLSNEMLYCKYSQYVNKIANAVIHIVVAI